MKKKLFSLCTALLVLILLCTGCSKVVNRFEDEELRQYTDTILDAIIADNLQSAYEPFKDICSEDNFAVVFYQMRDLIGYTDTYALQPLSINTNVRFEDGEKISSKDAIYKLTVGEKLLIVSVGLDSQRGLRGFTLTPYEITDYYSVGTLSNMKGANWSQILLLLSNLIPLGLVVFAFVDCIRKKPKNKVLWLLLLILGFVTLGITTSANGFQMNFNIAGLSGYSALIKYGSGTTTTRLMVPVGTFIYFIFRLSQVKNIPETAEVESAEPTKEQA